MKVVHICTSLEGGAGICAKRIVNATRSLGVDARVLVAKGNKLDYVDVIKPVYPWSKIWPVQKIQVFMNMFGRWPKTTVLNNRIAKELRDNQGTFTSPVTDYPNIASHPWIQKADIIHLHWIGNFVDYESFFKSVKKPIIWTIHDENPGLGGFHYTLWKDKATGSLRQLDDEFCGLKKRAYSCSNSLTLVAISTMMKEFFSKNELLSQFPCAIIHNGLFADHFSPIPVDCARQTLAIKNESKVFLFVSQDIHEDRKGLKALIEALEILNVPNTVLVCLGRFRSIPDASFEIRCEGFVGNNRLQSLYYSSADYYVMPSYQEAFAQTPMESMACGTPVVAFPCSGASDLINQENGVVCDDFTVEALVSGIKLAMSRSYSRDTIRKNLINRFSYDKIAKEYIELYKKVTE
jgi:glycosyltransferase involved in cell wall biosynthesis